MHLKSSQTKPKFLNSAIWIAPIESVPLRLIWYINIIIIDFSKVLNNSWNPAQNWQILEMSALCNLEFKRVLSTIVLNPKLVHLAPHIGGQMWKDWNILTMFKTPLNLLLKQSKWISLYGPLSSIPNPKLKLSRQKK